MPGLPILSGDGRHDRVSLAGHRRTQRPNSSFAILRRAGRPPLVSAGPRWAHWRMGTATSAVSRTTDRSSTFFSFASNLVAGDTNGVAEACSWPFRAAVACQPDGPRTRELAGRGPENGCCAVRPRRPVCRRAHPQRGSRVLHREGGDTCYAAKSRRRARGSVGRPTEEFAVGVGDDERAVGFGVSRC